MLLKGSAADLTCDWSTNANVIELQTERHSYEKCQYEEFKKRVAKMDELRAAKGGERSN
jgi:NADH-ubiquinone oxidoreductase B18 subunit (NDUFB7)